MEIRFVADTMLGRLAKWLRVLGYDTHYQRHYRPGAIGKFVEAGALFLTRHREKIPLYGGAIFLHGNTVGEQIAELKERLHLMPDRSKWFSRCLICNTTLKLMRTDSISENVPEYIFHQNVSGIKCCPSCERYYWPGSHKARMERQLEKWGFIK